MKTIVGALFSSLVVMIFSCLVQAGEFEGVIHMKTTRPDNERAAVMDWYIKGQKARMEMMRGDGKPHVMIVDGQARTMQIPISNKKMYMEMSLDQLGGPAQEHLSEALEKHSVERTGKSDKIAGYPCEVWRIADKETKQLEQEMCVAKGFGKSATFWLDPKEVRRSSQPGWVKELFNEGGFGLRTIHYGDDGKEESRTEATSIERKSLDDSVFAMPSDYRKMDREAMMSGMGGGAEGPGGEEFQRKLQEMKQRRAAQSGAAGNQGNLAPQQDVNEMMKQFGDMMKKRESGGQ
jgi:outer membrane lipoprotein-sorting protein